MKRIAEATERALGPETAKATAVLRLLFIIENDQPHAAAGGCYAIYKFGEFLARRGHSVHIYGVHDMHWVRTDANLSLSFRPNLPRRGRILTKLDRMLSRFGERWLLPRTIRRLRPDWILGFLTYSAIKAEALGRSFRVPVANFVYECPPWMREVYGEEMFRNFADPFTRRLWDSTRRAYLGSRILFPNSALSREYNSGWLDGKTVAEPIHPGIDPEQMPYQAPETEPVRLDISRKHLLFVGRLVKSKHVDDLIAASRRLDHAVELHVCGSGPEMAGLKSQAAGSPFIHFHGFVSDGDLWSLFRQCDLVVYPTEFEGFGMPPMQALYFGKPCLASDLAIFRSVFGDRLEYFPLGQVADLTAAIERLLGNPGYCRRRGEEGRQFVLEHFTWARAAETIERTLADAPQA
ncbi:MAG TPA: glycosyltransferase family 4 protein [Fibrobacteria bacterium]|nr:glycosyltransferase family 4 protein [Fibrobacteria bacterium]